MDAEFWWRMDLGSPIVDIRRMTAMQMLLDPPPADVAEELASTAAREDDGETRTMLLQVVERIRASAGDRPVVIPDPPAGQASAEAVPTGPWAEWVGTPAKRLAWLGRLPHQKRRELAEQAPDRLREETHSLAASALIRLFGRSWPEQRLEDLVPYAAGTDVAVCLAALETLRSRKAALLVPILPALLVSRNARVRGAAVRALAGVDLDEALTHLGVLLLDADPARRLEGLRCCLHVEFERVMPLLLKAMAIETDARRLAAYGTLFEINANLEAPFKLYELSEQVSDDRAEVLKKLVASACRVIGGTLLKPDEFQKFRDRLQSWIDRRAAAKLAQELVARASDGRGMDSELMATLERARSRPALWKALRDLSTLPMPAAARSLFLRALGEPPERTPDAPPSATAGAVARPAEPASKPSDQPPDLLTVLARLGPGDTETARREVTPLLASPEKTSAPLLAAALRAAVRARVSDQAVAARRLLTSPDPGAVAAAIEYLDLFAPDDLEHLLGRFLASMEPRIKTAAVRVLQRSDPLQAVSALKAMLRSRQVEQQKLGIACLVHVEFALVRDALADIFVTNPPLELLEAGLCLFQTNADPEGVYHLYLVEKQLPRESADIVRKVRRAMMKSLASDGRMPADTGIAESELARRAERETVKQNAAPRAYAYKVLKPSMDTPEPSAKNTLTGFMSGEIRTVAGIAGALLAVAGIALVLWNVLAGHGRETTPPTGPAPTISLAGSKLQIRQVDGWVKTERSSADEFLVEAETGELFWIPCRDYDPSPALGARFKGALVLMQKRSDGSWSSRRAATAGLR